MLIKYYGMNKNIKYVKSKYSLRKRELYSLLFIYFRYIRDKNIENYNEIEILGFYTKYRSLTESGYIVAQREVNKKLHNEYRLTDKGIYTLMSLDEMSFTDKDFNEVMFEFDNII